MLSIHCHAASRTFVCQSVNVIACCQLYSTYARVRGGGRGEKRCLSFVRTDWLMKSGPNKVTYSPFVVGMWVCTDPKCLVY